MSDTRGDLDGQRILIIGGGSRMGFATAKMAATRGAVILLASRSVERLEESAKEITGNVSVYALDATVPEDVEALFKKIAPIDHIVVTASSGETSAGGLLDTDPKTAQEAFRRFWICYHVLHFAPQTVKPTGSVTLLSGSSGRRPLFGYGVWSSLHGSIESLGRAAAIDLAPIRVNVVSPGGIGIGTDRQLAQHRGQPEDVAAMILSVIVNPAVTNALIDVDGGERLGEWFG